MVTVVASWLSGYSGYIYMQSDTLGLSSTVASFSFFSFLSKQVDFQLNIFNDTLCLSDVATTGRGNIGIQTV